MEGYSTRKNLKGNGTAGTTGKNPAERVGRFFKLQRDSGLTLTSHHNTRDKKMGTNQFTDPQPPFAPDS
jgi:hypothetical protein